MRTRALLVAATLGLVMPSPATAIDPLGTVGRATRGVSVNPPKAGVGSCSVSAAHGVAECVVQLNATEHGAFYQSTWSGYGFADVTCYLSGESYHLEGGYGTSWMEWHRAEADICLVRVTGVGGLAEARVE